MNKNLQVKACRFVPSYWKGYRDDVYTNKTEEDRNVKYKPLINCIVEDDKSKDNEGLILGRLERQNEREKGEGEHSATLPGLHAKYLRSARGEIDARINLPFSLNNFSISFVARRYNAISNSK